MAIATVRGSWRGLLAAALLLAGCTGSRGPADVPRPTAAVASVVAPATTVASQLAALPPDEGGVQSGEPAFTPLPEPPALPATSLPMPTPSVPTASPAPELTETPPTAPAGSLPTATVSPWAYPPDGVSPPMTFPSKDPYPLQIEVMRQQAYPGSEIVFEQTLDPGPNYNRYVVSYRSDGYKIYALMTIPSGKKPASGWPVIVFNHGFIPPDQYRTTQRYVAYVDAIARSGYIVFKSDYRGHGSSEGLPEGAYGSPGYTDDVLNAVASLKAYKDADPNRIGMWGHSMGGQLTLRAMVISKDIKAGVIWSGVVAPYPDVFTRSYRPHPTRVPADTPVPPGSLGPYGRPWRQELTAKYGTPQQNPGFWASISPNSYLADISGPLQLHHSVTDEEVPVESSQTLFEEMKAAGKSVELYTYPGDNHNISGNFARAMQRTIAFYDKYVKGS